MLQVIQDRHAGKIQVRDVPAPLCRDGFVLVRNAASLISTGTERATVQLGSRSLLGKALERPDLVRKVIETARRRGFRQALQAVRARLDEPGLLGYSCAGTVVEVGAGVTGLAPGDRAACAGYGYAVHAEFVAVPRNLVVPIPPGVSFEEGAFVAVGAIALHGVRTARVGIGDSVVVIGLGLLGLLATQILKAAGCTVLGVDLTKERCQLAVELGAHLALLPEPETVSRILSETHGRGADAVIITAATKSSHPMRLAADVARDRARVCIVGDVGMTVPRSLYYAKELELCVSRSYGPGRYDAHFEVEGTDYPTGYVPWTERRNFEEFLRLLAERRVTVDPLLTAQYPVEQAVDAYARLTARSERQPIAVLLKYPSQDSPRAVVQCRRDTAPTSNRPAVGVIGAGLFARTVLLPDLKQRNVNLRAVVTATPSSAEATARRFGFATAATDPKTVLNDPETDVIVIATRHDTHATFATEALRAGKNVFLEKPLALTPEELEQVRQAAESASGTFLVGYNRRFAPLAVVLGDQIRSWCGPLAIVYRVNAGALPADHWTRDPRIGGGRIIGEACHFVDFIQYLTAAEPLEVTAYAVRSADGGTPDTVTFQLRLSDGSVGTVHYFSLGDPPLPKERIEVFASTGAAVLDDFTRLELYSRGRRVVRRLRHQDKGHQATLTAFFDAVAGLRPAPIPLRSLILTSAVTFAVQESLRTGRPVPVRT